MVSSLVASNKSRDLKKPAVSPAKILKQVVILVKKVDSELNLINSRFEGTDQVHSNARDALSR